MIFVFSCGIIIHGTSELYVTEVRLNVWAYARKGEFAVFSSFGEFLTCVKEARFTFGVIKDWIVSFFLSVRENPDIAVIWDNLMHWIYSARILLISLLIVACLCVALFGKKIIGVIKFSFFFVVGFVVGTHYLAPLLPSQIDIPAWIIGVVIALIAAVLYRFLYIMCYVLTVGYGAYVFAYYGFFTNTDATYSGGRATACLIVALVFLVLAIIFRKYVEMVMTAFLGSWCAVLLFRYHICKFEKLALFSGHFWVAIMIPTIVLTAVTAVVQIKTRRRY